MSERRHTAGTPARHGRSRWRSLLRLGSRCRCGGAWPCAAALDEQDADRSDATELARRLAVGDRVGEPTRRAHLRHLQ